MYETKSIDEILEMLESTHGDANKMALNNTAHRAQLVAIEFKQHFEKNNNYVKNYLEEKNDGEILTKLYLTSCVTTGGGMYSVSHRNWLDMVYKTKLVWDRRDEDKPSKLQYLEDEYKRIQALALSYRHESPSEL
jgi:hypothetical protein